MYPEVPLLWSQESVMVPILSQMNLISAFPSYLLYVNFNIFLCEWVFLNDLLRYLLDYIFFIWLSSFRTNFVKGKIDSLTVHLWWRDLLVPVLNSKSKDALCWLFEPAKSTYLQLQLIPILNLRSQCKQLVWKVRLCYLLSSFRKIKKNFYALFCLERF